jgi:plasmid stability protein
VLSADVSAQVSGSAPAGQCYTETVKNITVSVTDELYHRARIRAAEKHSTVSAQVRHFLVQMVDAEPETERLQREQNELIERIRASHPGFSAADRITRDRLHERDAIR